MLMRHTVNSDLRLAGLSWSVPVEDIIIKFLNRLPFSSSCISRS